MRTELEAVAMFDYTARSPAELSLKQGDLLILHSKASCDWWRGEVGGVKGLIPHKYISVLDGWVLLPSCQILCSTKVSYGHIWPQKNVFFQTYDPLTSRVGNNWNTFQYCSFTVCSSGFCFSVFFSVKSGPTTNKNRTNFLNTVHNCLLV